nr:Phage protein [Kibdelosporangium sp. MJ126-NF4]
MLLAMVEAGRAVLLRQTGLAAGLSRDRIPLGRWILSPWRTWLLWRRMVLWQIADYHDALDMEAHIRRARTQLHTEYGSHWKRDAPADLVWMLNTAPFAREACRRIGTLPESTGALFPAQVAPLQAPNTTMNMAPDPLSDADGQLDQVIKINEHHWATRNRPVSADTVREQLHISATRARQLTKTVRAMDKATINNHQNRPTQNHHV